MTNAILPRNDARGIAISGATINDHFDQSEAARLLANWMDARPATTVRTYSQSLQHFSKHYAQLGPDLEQIVAGILQLARASKLNEVVRNYHNSMLDGSMAPALSDQRTYALPPFAHS